MSRPTLYFRALQVGLKGRGLNAATYYGEIFAYALRHG